MLDQKIIIIGNDDIILLMGLLGIEGYVVEKSEEFLKVLERVIKDSSVGVILIGVELSKEISDYLIEYKLNNKRPFLFILPDVFKQNLEEIDPIILKIQDSIGEII